MFRFLCYSFPEASAYVQSFDCRIPSFSHAWLSSIWFCLSSSLFMRGAENSIIWLECPLVWRRCVPWRTIKAFDLWYFLQIVRITQLDQSSDMVQWAWNFQGIGLLLLTLADFWSVFLKWIIAYVLSIFLSLIAQSFHGKFFHGYSRYRLPCSEYLVVSIRAQFSSSVQQEQ